MFYWRRNRIGKGKGHECPPAGRCETPPKNVDAVVELTMVLGTRTTLGAILSAK